MLTLNNYLEYVDISGNAIRDEGFTALMRGISSNVNGHVVMLNVSRNDITYNGVKCLNTIRRVLPLEQLHMSNNLIKSEGIITISNNVSCCLRQLNKLYVSECGIDFNGFIHVVRTYAHGVHRLHTLVLDNNALNINERYDNTLSEVFTNFNVCNLSLRNCALSAVAVSYIADFLKTNDVVRSVNLSLNNITDTAFNAFAALPRCTRVMTKFDVSCNLITNVSAIPFITALIDNTTLSEVNLSNNQIRNETACALLQTLEHNVTLMHVNVGMNFVKSEIIDKVNTLLKRNRTVRKGRCIPQLKANIKMNKVDQDVYALFKGEIRMSQQQRVKLMRAVKEDEEKYEKMKMELRKELDVVLAKVDEVDKEIAKVNEDYEVKVSVVKMVKEVEEKVMRVRKEVKMLEVENGRLRKDVEFNGKDYEREVEKKVDSLKVIKEKNKIMEMNVKGKLKELQQKKEMLNNNNGMMMMVMGEGKVIIPCVNKDNNDECISKSKMMVSDGTKLHVVDDIKDNNKEKGTKKKNRGVSAKYNLSKSKKKKKSIKNVKPNKHNKVKSIDNDDAIIKPKKHHKTFSVLPLTNNDIPNLYKISYDTSLKRKNQHEQHIIQQRSRMECNSTSISKYGETDLTSPKPSLLNTVVSNN